MKIIRNIETQEIYILKELRPLSLWPIFYKESDHNVEISLTPEPTDQGYEIIE